MTSHPTLSPSPTRGSNAIQDAKTRQVDGRLGERYDSFLKILAAEMKNQDPLSPMDTHEFTNQLVMFEGVGQLVRQSGQLESLVGLGQQNEATAAVGYIGKSIKADYNEVNFTGEPVKLTYDLPEDAVEATLEVYNQDGDLVAIMGDVPKEAGAHTVTWDGKDSKGNPLPEGAYDFQVNARNADKKAINASYTTRGTVTGVKSNGGRTTLLIGDAQIPLSRVLRVGDGEDQVA